MEHFFNSIITFKNQVKNSNKQIKCTLKSNKTINNIKPTTVLLIIHIYIYIHIFFMLYICTLWLRYINYAFHMLIFYNKLLSTITLFKK